MGEMAITLRRFYPKEGFSYPSRILDSLKCLQMSQVLKESLAKNAKDAKVFLGGLGVFDVIERTKHPSLYI